MRLGAVPVVVTIVLFSGCHDSTGPAAATKVDVALSDATGPVIEQPSPAETKITCGLTFRAAASGGGKAVWLTSWFFFYAGPDRAAPVDSTQVSEADVRLEWGASEIQSGETQVSHWLASASAPFAIVARFRYQLSDGAVKEAVASHACGPDIPAGTSPPTIQATLNPSDGEVQGGDTLTLRYITTSSVGLWAVKVVFSGACRWELLLLENLVSADARTLKLSVPPSCRLGDVFNVSIQAYDAALRGADAGPLGTLTLVDRTRPRVNASFGFNGQTELTGLYFGGDTIPAYLGGTDNQALSGVYRDVLPWGRRDSLLTSAPSVYARMDIPIPEDWVGGIQVRAFSRDAVGLVSDTIVTPPDSLRVFPTVSRAVQSRTMSGPIRDVIFDQRRDAIYLLNSGPDYVAVLSTTDLAVVDSIPLPGPASDFDITVSGDTLVLVLGASRALGIVDLNGSPRTVVVHPLTTLNVAMDQRPELVRIPANGKIFVRLNGATLLQATLLEVDLSSGVERVRSDAGDNGLVGFVTMERSHDHSAIVLWANNHLQRYDASGDVFGPLTDAASSANRVSLDATGSRLALGLDVYDAATLTFERRVESPAWDPFLPVALSPDGQLLYHYSIPQGVLRADASTGHLLDRVRTPAVSFMRASSDGMRLALLNWKTIYLMDLR